MALVAAGVANEGADHDAARDARGARQRRRGHPRRPSAAVWQEAVSRPQRGDHAQTRWSASSSGGTATRLAIPGIAVGGKTGTAQLGTDPPRSHAWIIGFARPTRAAREVAVAVIVEGQPGASEQTGGRVAAPIAKAVMAKILQTQ